jgi:DNA-binding XRE family transcriptional regulator
MTLLKPCLGLGSGVIFLMNIYVEYFPHCRKYSVDCKSLRLHISWVSSQLLKYQLNLAERVKTLRLELGISQEALALEAGIDRTYASQIERGISNPSLRVICAVAEVLKVEPTELLSTNSKT